MKKALLLLVLGSHGADTYWTNRNINSPGITYEGNPLERPFVHGKAWCWSAGGLQAGAVILGAHVLRKHHHGTMADALELSDIGAHTTGAVVSWKMSDIKIVRGKP